MMTERTEGRFPYQIVAAPMAGISNRVFRDICRSHGAELAYGEMVSATALHYENRRTLELLDLDGENSPKVVQLFGSQVEYMREAAFLVAELGAEWIDLNMGCPVPKVVKNGEGAALMQQPLLAQQLVRAAAEPGLPVSVKLRSGWDEDSRCAADFAQRMEMAGATLLAVHGRTRMQLYQGKADWQEIARVKQAVTIPVLGSGDVTDGASALAMRQQTGCDGVMVGRAMLGNPWVFEELAAAFAGAPPPQRPTPAQILEEAIGQLRRQRERSVYWACFREGEDSPAVVAEGELAAVRAMRNQLSWYVKGLRNSAALRCAVNQLTRVEDVESLLLSYLEQTYCE